MAHPGEFGTPLLEVADQIVADAAALEVDIEAGFFQGRKISLVSHIFALSA